MPEQSLCTPKVIEKAFQLTLLGASDKVLAAALDVKIDTINKWKQKHPAFLEAIRQGKVEADARVALALFKNATGYDYDEEVVVSYKGQEPQIVTVKRHVKADSWAAARWLSLRQRENWAEIQRSESKNTNVNILKLDLTGCSTEELLLVEKLGLKQLTQINAENNTN